MADAAEGGEVSVHCAHTELVATEKVIPNPRNPNKHPDAQIALLAKIIDAQGWRAPITVSRRSGFVVRGHGRLLAAQKLGLEQVPVDYQDYESEALEWADLIADNRIAELAEPSLPEVFDLIAELDTGEIDLELTGFTLEDIENMVTALPPEVVEDEAPEPPEEPKTKRGDIYQLGRHRLMCGDSTMIDEVERLMDGARAVMMATDPPYGIDYSKTKDGIPRSGFQNHQEQWGDIKNDELTEGPAFQAFLEEVFRTATAAAITEDAAWYLWHPMLTQGFFAAAAAAADILLHRQIIWVKPGFVLTRSGMYHWKHELCFYGWRKGNQPPWYGDKSQVSVWECGRDNDSGQHPTQKPVELFFRPMKNHVKQGQAVYEPFAGSGSQFIAAEQFGAKCYGMELSERYCDVIIARWEKFTGKKAELV